MDEQKSAADLTPEFVLISKVCSRLREAGLVPADPAAGAAGETEGTRLYARAMAAAALGWDPTSNFMVYGMVMGFEPESTLGMPWPKSI